MSGKYSKVAPGRRFGDMVVKEVLGKGDDGQYWFSIECDEGHDVDVVMPRLYQGKECPECYRIRAEAKREAKAAHEKERAKASRERSRLMREAKLLIARGFSHSEAARQTGLCLATVRTLRKSSTYRGMTWTEQQSRNVRNRMIQDLVHLGWSPAMIVRQFAISYQRVGQIKDKMELDGRGRLIIERE